MTGVGVAALLFAVVSLVVFPLVALQRRNAMEDVATALAAELRQPRLEWQASFMRAARRLYESMGFAVRASLPMCKIEHIAHTGP